jgi:hypothetical protein
VDNITILEIFESKEHLCGVEEGVSLLHAGALSHVRPHLTTDGILQSQSGRVNSCTGSEHHLTMQWTYIENEENVAVILKVALEVDNELEVDGGQQGKLILGVLNLVLAHNFGLLKHLESVVGTLLLVLDEEDTAVRAAAKCPYDIKVVQVLQVKALIRKRRKKHRQLSEGRPSGESQTTKSITIRLTSMDLRFLELRSFEDGKQVASSTEDSEDIVAGFQRTRV